MIQAALLVAFVAQSTAFPFVAEVPGINRRLLDSSPASRHKRASDDTCPFNPVHNGAVPINSQYPYLGAINGSKSTGKGGIQVPTPGDTAHYFTPPGPLDIRGPCPGLNTMANHNFLSHDGITTYNELVDAQQNVFNIGQNLANLLAVFGVGLDGDLATGRLSIGCEADSRTNPTSGLTGTEPGLNGHNKFEADSSLTRNDFFLANGDNHSRNETLFDLMARTVNGNFDRSNLGYYRQLRYNQSRAENGNFFFGPGTLLMYGAATFLYRSFPSFGGAGTPDLATQKSFFGFDGDYGNFTANSGERIPDNWFNNVQTYDLGAIGNELFSMYAEYPVQFGGNIGQAGNFNAMNYSTYLTGGFFNEGSAQSVMCLLYQAATSGVPTSLSNVYQIPANGLAFVLGKLAPGFQDLGCPGPLYPSELPIIGS